MRAEVGLNDSDLTDSDIPETPVSLRMTSIFIPCQAKHILLISKLMFSLFVLQINRYINYAYCVGLELCK